MSTVLPPDELRWMNCCCCWGYWLLLLLLQPTTARAIAAKAAIAGVRLIIFLSLI